MRASILFVPLLALGLGACSAGSSSLVARGDAGPGDAGLDAPLVMPYADAQPDVEVIGFPDAASPAPEAGGGGQTDAGGGGQTDAGSCTSPVDIIINDARSHLGQPYKWGAEGPNAYDCSGLVYAVFKETGYFSIIGNGSARTVAQIASVFRARGDEDTVNLERGDLITFGNSDGYPKYEHIGIYEGKHNQAGAYTASGWVVNALNPQAGVVENKVSSLIPKVETYLHTHLADLPCK
jgi:cell wall-associated NlpC family hydrolase